MVRKSSKKSGSKKATNPAIAARIKHNSSDAGRSITTDEGIAAVHAVIEASEAESIDCALCGGVAMHLYGFTRATRDVDVIADELLPLRSVRDLSFGGEVYRTKVGGKTIEVDWIVRADDKQAAYDAALADAVQVDELGISIITPEWLVILKFLAGRGKDHIDLMFLLREENLVDREATKQLVKELLGRAAYWAIRDLEALFLEADLLRARDES